MYSAVSFRERAGNSVKTCFQPALAFNLQCMSYLQQACLIILISSWTDILQVCFPRKGKQRQRRLAEVSRSHAVPGLLRWSIMPELLHWGRGPRSPCYPLPPLPSPRFPWHRHSLLQTNGSHSGILGAGAKPQSSNPPCQPLIRGKGNIGPLSWKVLHFLLVFFTVTDIFVLHIISLPAFHLWC